MKRLLSGALVVLTGVVSVPLGAEMVYRFEPSLELALMHDGHADGSAVDEELSDEVALLRPVLPLVGESERTTWSLSYAPEAKFFRTYSDLNRLDHRAEMRLNRTIDRRSDWELGGVYLNTSDTYSELLEQDLITVRSDRQLMAANTVYSVGVSRRVDLSFSYDFREIEFDDPDIIGYTSHEAGVSTGLATSLKTSVALDYAYQLFSYPGSGDFGTHNVLTRFTARPTERDTLTLAGGAYFQDYQAEDTGGGEQAAGQNDTGFIGNIEWGRKGRRFDFDAGFTRRVRASGGIDSSVLSHAFRLGLSGALGPKVTMSLSGLFQRNEPTVSTDEGNVDMMRSSVSVDYAVARHVGLRFFADYIYQKWDDETLGDLNYPRAGVSVVLSTARAGVGTSTVN